MKQKILDELENTPTSMIERFLKDNGVSGWKLALATRQDMIDGIKKEMAKYSEDQLKSFYDKYLS